MDSYRGVFHAWTRIDLNEPHVKVRVDHKIVAEHLVRVLPVHHHLSGRQNAPYDAFFDLRYNLLSVYIRISIGHCFLKMLSELVAKPHVALDLRVGEVLRLRSNAVVG